jgi:hypothetical protein
VERHVRDELRPFIERTGTMLEAHWRAVEALAEALIEHGRIEGERVQVIVNRARSRNRAA